MRQAKRPAGRGEEETAGDIASNQQEQTDTQQAGDEATGPVMAKQADATSEEDQVRPATAERSVEESFTPDQLARVRTYTRTWPRWAQNPW